MLVDQSQMWIVTGNGRLENRQSPPTVGAREVGPERHDNRCIRRSRVGESAAASSRAVEPNRAATAARILIRLDALAKLRGDETRGGSARLARTRFHDALLQRNGLVRACGVDLLQK